LKLGVVSDIHCQHGALERALEALGPGDRLVCAGDAIDQARFCNRTVASCATAASSRSAAITKPGSSPAAGRVSPRSIRSWPIG
jgi:hypothetical protein